MSDEPAAADRAVRIQTVHGTVEGILPVSPVVRTLDDLNVVSRNFLTVHAPVVPSRGWPFDGPELAVNKSSILFLMEFSGGAARRVGRPEAAAHTRAPVRLRVGEYSIEGFLHVPRGGNPMTRLNQAGHPFIALTSAFVVGPDARFTTAFLAVNRAHILAAQEVQPLDEETEPLHDHEMVER